MPYKVENERKRRRKQEGHFCLPEYLIWSITGEAIFFCAALEFLRQVWRETGCHVNCTRSKKYYYCFIILLAMLWWVNGVIHRKNSFATFPAKLHTSEATLSFKNYKQKKKTKTNSRFVMHHSPFPSHLNSPLSTHLFSCRGDWIDTPKSGTYRETRDHLFRLAQGR